MKKTYIIFIVFVLLVVVGLTARNVSTPALPIALTDNTDTQNQENQPSQTKDGYKNTTYIIEGQPVTLINGASEVSIVPSSASKVITRYFGNEIKHDLNDDGREDVVFLLTQNSGGSGTNYYVVAALNMDTGYIGSRGFLLGDRIAPQTTQMDEGITVNGTNRKNVIVVNYAIRKPGEAFTVAPSVGKTIWLKLDPVSMELIEVGQNFEGESR